MPSTLRTRGKPSNVSMAAAQRLWEVTIARLEKATPQIYDAVAVVDDAAAPGTGPQLTGTIVAFQDATVALVDVTPGNVHRHNVRNVLTYAATAESTFGPLREGQRVYFDRSATMPAGVFLSTSPQDNNGVANPVFGRIVLDAGEPSADFPKGDTTAQTLGSAVMQVGCAY